MQTEDEIEAIVKIAWEYQRSEEPETIPLCEEMNTYADTFYEEIMKGI